MKTHHSKLDRIALIAELVDHAPTAPGRTMLMKCLYFLKAVKDVPIPYTFRLYTYGPFDSDVLDDLSYAESLGAIKSTLVAYPGGQGYEFELGPESEKIKQQSKEFLKEHKDSIDWVLLEFGNRSALDLEMASTLIFIDRTLSEKGTKKPIAEIAKKVRDVKPHLDTKAIEEEAKKLNQKGLLTAITESVSA